MHFLLGKNGENWIKKNEKNVEGIPGFKIPKSFADESFRLIDNDKNDSKSDSGQNSVERDGDNFTFIYLLWRNGISCRKNKNMIW